MANNSALSSVNTTAVFHQYSTPHWTPSLTGQAIVLGLSFFSNSLIFIEFIRIPSRVTPFTMYLLVLLLSNICFLISPLTELINELYGYWWMGRAWCNFHNYANGVISASQICIHVTISINRLWAVHSPISYRNHHNKKTALLTCLGAVVFAHIVGLPGCIIDAVYYAIDLKYGCHINYGKQVLWGQMQQALLHLLPLLFIIVAYVHLCINRIRRRKKLADHPSNGSRKTGTTEDNDNVQVVEKPAAANTAVSTNNPTKPPVKKEAVKPFLVLSFTAISVTICWTPACIYFAASIFFGVWMSVTFFTVAVTFYSMQALFDPWLFALCLLTANKTWDSLRCRC